MANTQEDRTMVTQNPEPEERDVEPTEARGFRKPIDVPVVYATIDPLTWKDDEQVLKGLRCVTVDWNLAVAETVSVSLSSSDPDDYVGQVFFDLTPADALLLAEELRLAAAEAQA